MRKLFIAVCVVSVVLQAHVSAQQVTGNIVGNVVDAQGASVPDAQVTATNSDTGLARTVQTNREGEYRFDLLPPGKYAIEVTAHGFSTFRQTGIVLQVGQFARVDASLKLGQASESVTVTSAVPLINTTNATVGQTIDTQQITTLPLVNRNAYNLLTLVPGYQNTTQAITLGYPEQRTFLNGGSDATMGSVNYYLDGGPNMNDLRNTGNVVPNPDAIDEFRVETSNYSAEYGRFGNGVINVITRSGTNDFHGSAFEFLRNTKLNANTYNALAKPPLHRNQFGGTFGGPVMRNKTFFFATYSGLRQSTTTFLNGAVVPTIAQRNGNFSGSKPIIDPRNGIQFNNNMIPVSRFDPTAVNILNKYIPLANLPNNVFQGQVRTPYNSDEWMGKVDHLVTDKQRITGSYYTTSGTNDIVSGSSPNIPWSTQHFEWRQHNANVSDTWTIGDHAVNQAWLNYTRYFGSRVNLPAISLHDLGSTFTPQGPPALPQIAVTGYFTLGQSIAGPVAGSNIYTLRDVFGYTTGRHSLRFGGEVGLAKDVQRTLLNDYGIFNFTGAKTGPRTNQGDAFADFLLGLPNTMNQDAPEDAYYDSWNMGLFLQDDFKVHPRLTLNLGVRYDIQTPPVDPQNREETFIAGRQSTVIPNAPPGLLVVGDKGVERGVVPVRRDHISPRVGLAWDPFGNGKTSIRAGGGVFFGSVSGNGWGAVENSQPFAVRQQFSNVASLTNPYASFPGGVSPFPYIYSPNNARFILPASLLPIDTNFRWPYSYQFNFSVQREIGGGVSLSGAYVGTFSHHLAFGRDVNYPIFTSTATSSNYNNRRPIAPGLLSSVVLMQSNQTASYNALQITAKKALGKYFSLNSYYVFSKSLSGASLDQQSTNPGAQDFNNVALEHGRSDYDQRHTSVTSLIWNVSYYTGNSGMLRNLLNGWNLAPIITFRSGLPFTVTTGKDNNYDGSTTDRPNIVGNPYLSPNRSRAAVTQMWFNINAFVPNPIGTDGNAGRNILDGPGQRNVDLGIYRDFAFGERAKLQFRSEFTNAFNLVSLNAPNATLSSANVGQITSAREMRQVQLGLRVTF
ncbi:MAG: TonB-dependent receptor [Acidobacteriaceae bacterium]|nr:TonB-dependent receptor [Acidobacteriaceae bacterium]